MSKSTYCLATALLLFQLFAGCSRDKESAPDSQEIFETVPPVFKPVIQKVNDVIGGYYQALPAMYSETNKKYPLLLFIHGGGQFGNGSYDLPLLLNEGIPQLLDEQKFPADFIVDGTHHSFIVLAPQFNKVPDNTVLTSFLDYAKQRFRLDETRIYICGFSLGSRIVFDYSAEFAGMIAAIVPISGVPNLLINEKAKKIAMANLPVWAFHNQPDVLFSAQETKNFISSITSFNPARTPRLTIFTDSTGLLGHDAWSKATNPSYKENDLNIYEWMLRHKR